MFTTWNDLDRTFDRMDTIFRRVFDPAAVLTTHRGPARRGLQLKETEDALIFTTDLPGVEAGDIEIELHEGVLSIQANRSVEAPEGYEAQRLERGGGRYSRSFVVPTAVDPDRTTATLDKGILTIRLEKAEDARPRRITVGA